MSQGPDLAEMLKKWHEAKDKMDLLEGKIKKYKLAVLHEMNRKNVDKLEAGGFTVTRRRNTRSYLSKDSVPSEIWKEYSTRTSYDAFFLVKKY